MSLEVGELHARLSLDQSSYDSGIKGIKGSLLSMGGFTAKVAAGMGAAIGAAFAAAGTMGIKANSDTEQFIATMEVLTGSTDKAKQSLADLKTFAANTPFELSDLKQGELTMKSIGIESNKWRNTIGDTAAAFQSSGKTYQDVVDAIADAQTGELERLKEFGITKQQIVDFANDKMKKSNIVNNKGQITDQQTFNDALKGLMESRYKGMMDKQSKTFAGMLSTLKDFGSNAMEIMSKPIFDKMKSGLDKLMPVLNDLQKSGAFEKMAESVGNAIGKIGSIFKTIGPIYASAVGPVFETIMSSVGKIGPMIDGMKPFLSDLFKTWVTVFKGIWSVVNTVVGFLAPMIMGVIGSVISWWKTNGQDLLSNFRIVFAGILAVVNFIMPVIKLIVGSIFENIKGVIVGALNIISAVFKIFAGLFTGDWSKMWDGVKQLVGGALQFLWNLFSLMMIGKLIGGFKAFITSGWTLFKNFGVALKGTFADFFNNIINLFGYFRATGTGIWSAIVATVRNIISTFVNAAKANFQGLLNGAASIFQRIKSAITDPIGTAKNVVKGFIDEIKGFFKGLKLKLPDIKTPHFKIKNWSKNPVDWVKAMPSISVDWFKTGGIATGPAIAGIGEAGSEAIVPLAGRRMKPFSDAIAKQLAALNGQWESKDSGGKQTVVILEIDGKKFAKAVAKPMDNEIKTMKQDEERQRGDV